MAESADILTGERQKVILPDMTAGCSMADMADIEQVRECWENLRARRLNSERIVPVCYVNSTAAIKAFCGEQGGLCCTSSNCRMVLESLYRKRQDAVVLFLPDEHLGRNTGWAMGFHLDQMPGWDPFAADGGTDGASLEKAAMVLWKGFCSVHQEFTVNQIQEARCENPNIQIMVHPECCFEVARAADYVGSTSQILQRVRSAETGSSWALGTEINLVNRLAAEMAVRGVAVRCLSSTVCLCETMYRIDLAHLAWVMDGIAAHIQNPSENKLYNQVVVDPQIRAKARIALEKMLTIANPMPDGGKASIVIG